MMNFITAFQLLLSMFPAPIQTAILAILAVLAIIIVFKIVAMVLNAIPFL